MAAELLVLNAGSSSLKFSLFAGEESLRPLLRGQLEELWTRPRFVAREGGRIVAEQRWESGTRLGHEGAIDHLVQWLKGSGVRGVGAVGHRVVHGGTRFVKPTRVDGEVLDALEALVPLAPLHQPHNVAAMRAVARAAPALPQVACFDTAFHATQPAVAQRFALPRAYFERGVRRYGFHGLSYEYVTRVLMREHRASRAVVAHLGNGASLCALAEGRSVATTMGFSTLDGLVMGTRSGSIDPGVLLYLLDEERMDSRGLERLLYEQSGLKGLSGGSSDMRELLARKDEAAAEAVESFVYRIVREVGSLAAALGGLDAIVFTGGIGENSAPVRARVCEGAAWLGLDLDDDANARGGPGIATVRSRVKAWVIPTDEELMIALHTQRVLSG